MALCGPMGVMMIGRGWGNPEAGVELGGKCGGAAPSMKGVGTVFIISGEGHALQCVDARGVGQGSRNGRWGGGTSSQKEEGSRGVNTLAHRWVMVINAG